MIRHVLMLYLLDGRPVGFIADSMREKRAAIRGYLKNGGISIRPTPSGYMPGRGTVCDAVRRAGFSSFHEFVQIRGLNPITEQSSELGVTEKALSRVYNAYRQLLADLKAAGIMLPNSQLSGVDLE